MAYRKYDQSVKDMIIATGNRNMFPALNIPRTTASYWIKYSKRTISLERQDDLMSINDHSQQKIRDLRAKNILLERLLEQTCKSAELNSIFGRDKKNAIIKIIDELKIYIPVRHSLKLLKISPSSFYRWRAEVNGCPLGKINECRSGHPKQLTRREQLTMCQLATDPKLQNYSIKSLMYYAQRRKILFCGIDSWRKYLKLNRVIRPKINNQKRKNYRIGIRAKRANQIWHIDITELKTSKGEKLYLQMVVDNFSRMIVGWKVHENKSMQLTMKTLRSSCRSLNDIPEYLMSDGGRENDNSRVEKLLYGKGIEQLIALSNVDFSNSMIEAVFRQFKQTQKIDNIKNVNDFGKCIRKFVKNHNFLIPHSALGGATPQEIMDQSWDADSFKKHLLKQRELLLAERKNTARQCFECVQSTQRPEMPTDCLPFKP